MENKMETKKRAKTKVGTVVSNGMEKSVVVLVTRTVLEPTYKKYVRKKNKFMAHDESNALNIGDTVQIRECRPLSKCKHWKVEKVITKSSGVE